MEGQFDNQAILTVIGIDSSYILYCNHMQDFAKCGQFDLPR